MVFKEKIRPEIVAIGSGRGRGIKASWERFELSGVVPSIPARIGLNFASKGVSKLGHDLHAIGHD